jgi:hypothetical protein
MKLKHQLEPHMARQEKYNMKQKGSNVSDYKKSVGK